MPCIPRSGTHVRKARSAQSANCFVAPSLASQMPSPNSASPAALVESRRFWLLYNLNTSRLTVFNQEVVHHKKASLGEVVSRVEACHLSQAAGSPATIRERSSTSSFASSCAGAAEKIIRASLRLRSQGQRRARANSRSHLTVSLHRVDLMGSRTCFLPQGGFAAAAQPSHSWSAKRASQVHENKS